MSKEKQGTLAGNRLRGDCMQEMQEMVPAQPFDIDKKQKEIDKRNIRALAQGLLKIYHQPSGQSLHALQYFVQTRGNGVWINHMEARAETGLEPQMAQIEFKTPIQQAQGDDSNVSSLEMHRVQRQAA